MMPSNHLVLCRPLLLLPSIFPSISIFSNESALFASGGQSIGASASASVLPMNIQDWLVSSCSPGDFQSLLQHHSSKASILQCSAFFMVQLSHPYTATGKTIALTIRAFVGKVMSLLFNMLSTFVIPFLPRSMSNACDPVDCSLSGSSVHGISQARILKWVAVSCSRGPRIKCLLISQKGSQTN